MHSRWRWTGVDVTRIAEYAIRLGKAPAKRLGWVLAYFGCKSSEVDRLAELLPSGLATARSIRRDPEGEAAMPAGWFRENLSGLVGR